VRVNDVAEDADLLDVLHASFTRKQMKPRYDPLLESELSVDRFAQSRRDRFTVRQPSRKEEYKLPFEHSDESPEHSLRMQQLPMQLLSAAVRRPKENRQIGPAFPFRPLF
jgi:hypothetical protein